MQNTTERRQEMLDYLSTKREATRSELAEVFAVSERTVQRDIEILTCSAPIFTVQGGAGGIRVADGWYVGRKYLRNDQEEFLKSLMDGLQPDQQATMNEILLAFAKPHKEECR